MKLSFTLYMVTMISKTEESVIHTERTTQKATQGHTVTLQCPLEAGSLTVQWQKDRFGLGFDPELSSFPRYTYVRSEASCDLVIEEVNIKDGGLYTCIAVYPGAGVTVASSVQLEVMVGVSQPQILQDNPLILLEGQKVVLKCMSQGKPAPDLSWRHEDDSLVAANVNTTSVRLSRDLFKTETHLTFTARRSQQFSEKIVCSAQNFVEKKSTAVTVYVHHAPQVELIQLNRHGAAGLLQFRCSVTAKPRVERVDWQLNRRPLPPHLVSADTLSLTARPELAGATIACNASNYLGSEAREVRITVGESRVAPDVQPATLITNTQLDIGSHNEGREESQGNIPILATILLIVLGSLVTVLLTVLSVIVYYKYQKRKIKQPLKAINRYGGQDLLNNEDKLFQDLMCTRHKGVNDMTVAEPPMKPIQLSRRSSLRSFFPDSAEMSPGNESLVTSLVTSSVVDSGVSSNTGEERTGKVETSV